MDFWFGLILGGLFGLISGFILLIIITSNEE